MVSSIALITAQRLVRRLCVHCKQSMPLDQQRLRSLGLPEHQMQTPAQWYQPVGCTHCHKGFAGRVGIFQVMPISDVLSELILQDASVSTLALQSQREGVSTLRQAGLRKVWQGITSLDEVLAATP
jgi:type IV pilus assembly protein PilB